MPKKLDRTPSKRCHELAREQSKRAAFPNEAPFVGLKLFPIVPSALWTPAPKEADLVD